MSTNLCLKSSNSFLFLLFVMAVGCQEGRTEFPTAVVAGTVTYNGKPLDKGRVVFVHNSGKAVGADIAVDGTFKVAAFLGENHVAVSCYSPEEMPNSPYARPGISIGKSLIPDRYANCSTSGLSFEVESDGSNKAEFTLED